MHSSVAAQVMQADQKIPATCLAKKPIFLVQEFAVKLLYLLCNVLKLLAYAADEYSAFHSHYATSRGGIL